MLETSRTPTIQLGPYRLADVSPDAFIRNLTELAQLNANKRSTIVFSLHVGGLNLRHDTRFIRAVANPDFLVADGISVAVLARIAGARGMHRHPTTDRGWELLDALARELARPVRVALVGGPPGLAARAGAIMTAQAPVEVVLTEHGYHDDWTEVINKLGAAACDVVIVGMGMPGEAYWVTEHRDALPKSVIITCGGWFGHIVGDEKRAPSWMRKAGLEWLARLAQSPRRLWKRYATGMWSLIAMVPVALASRRSNPR